MVFTETFVEARNRILDALEADGWKTAKGLKLPHATSPNGRLRFWFKKQAIWFSAGETHKLANARSTHLEMRHAKHTDVIRQTDALLGSAATKVADAEVGAEHQLLPGEV